MQLHKGQKEILQPQLILTVTMQKIHNVDNALLMFFHWDQSICMRG